MAGYSQLFFEGTAEDFERMSVREFDRRFGPSAVKALCPLDHHVITSSIELGKGINYGCICCGTRYFFPFTNKRMEFFARSRLIFLEELEENLRSDDIQKRTLHVIIDKAHSYCF
ncbi:hypothetical protein J4467_01810 [Candidatus Woesearchaeota archaeon]|nr:hypothetical protein [Candidatus Woesearchaeota archaeon]